MNANIVSKEKNTVKFTFQVAAEKFEEGLTFSYNKNKKNIALPGFRKGKAPRKLIEAQYGEDVFYDDAINYVLNGEYEEAIKELELDVVSKPEINVDTVDKAEGVTFSIAVTVKPEVTLGQYKGLEVEKISSEVEEEDILKELKKVQDKNARTISITDREAKMDDIVNVSYEGTIDGVAFDGGKADSYELTLGSHTFIGDFEEQIVGHKVGDKFDVNVTFPEDYHAEELAGKPAVFAVEVKEISEKELPELNDEFAQDVSEFETLDAYKDDIRAKLKADKEEAAKKAISDKLMDIATANTTMDVPPIMYENKIDQLIHDFEQNLGRQGLSLDVYCKYMGATIESLRDTFKETARKSVNARLMLEKVAEVENIVVSKEELDSQIEKIGAEYGLKEGQAAEIFVGEEKEALEKDMRIRKALEFIEETAVLVSPEK